MASVEAFKRVSKVITVLYKHGLGKTIIKLDLAGHLGFVERMTAGVQPLPADMPKRLREAMEELGGAYVKLGQLLSIRPDLIPQEYCDEFSKLLDEVPPEPYETVVQTIEKEFGHKTTELYSHIDHEPLGSASVAQVHKARLKNGKAVVVKVQKSHVAEQFAADLEILRYFAKKLQIKLQNNVNPILIVDEFERYSQKELNFLSEAEYIEAVRNELANFKRVKIPKVYWSHTSKKVLTMDYLEGRKLSDLNHVKVDREQVAKTIIDCLIAQVFDHGTFHADMHPGNILVMPKGVLGLLDFGIVGSVDQRTRKLGIDLYLSILDKNTQKISEVMLNYGKPTAKTDVDKFVNDVTRLVNIWYESDPHKRRVTHLMHQMFILCAQNHIVLPRETILLGKALVTAEATAHYVDPQFNFVAYSEPKIAQMLKKEKTPKKIIQHFTKRSKELAEAISKIPASALETLKSIKEGELSINIKDTDFRHLGSDINLSSNRLSYSLIAAACILAGSWLINIGPRIGPYSALSVFSFIVASLFVIILFWSVIREGTPKYDPHPTK